MKPAIYVNTVNGNLHELISDDLSDPTDPELRSLRMRDLRHALSRIAAAKRRGGTNEAVFKHNHATMHAVHAALRQLGYLPRKYDVQVSVVTWPDPV